MSVGYIHVYTGPMRSRKSLEVLLLAREAQMAGRKVIAFYPAETERWGTKGYITSRVVGTIEGDLLDNSNQQGESLKLLFHALPLSRDLTEVFEYIGDDTDVVVFDDAQFFGMSIINIVQKLRMLGKSVYISGLDMDYLQQPFGPMPFLMSIADKVYKKTAICSYCGEPAKVSFRVTSEDNQELVGDEEYNVCCYYCYNKKMEQRVSTSRHAEVEE